VNSIDGGIEYLVILGTTAEMPPNSAGEGIGYKTVIDTNNGQALVLGVEMIP
jgi:hypothetical protein